MSGNNSLDDWLSGDHSGRGGELSGDTSSGQLEGELLSSFGHV